MSDETHAGREARARQDEVVTENADDAMPDDPLDCSPDEYNVSDTLAVFEDCTAGDLGDDTTLPNPEIVTNDG